MGLGQNRKVGFPSRQCVLVEAFAFVIESLPLPEPPLVLIAAIEFSAPRGDVVLFTVTLEWLSGTTEFLAEPIR